MTPYRQRVPVQVDHATGHRVCALCWADMDGKPVTARFCSDQHRHIAKARRQRSAR